jgi:cation diffusion facilitator family transporter
LFASVKTNSNPLVYFSIMDVILHRKARAITLAGMVINILLAALKFALGVWGRSQAVIADAIHSLSDMVTDLLVLVSLKFRATPADNDHPYGHHRIETIISVIISVILATAGIGIGWSAINRLGQPVEHPPLFVALIGPLASIILKEMLFRRTRSIGKEIHSSALIANAWHHRSDAFSSIPTLIAVAIASTNPAWAFLDPVGALIVALLILKAVWDIASPALAELTERGADSEDVKKIAQLVQTVQGVHSVHRIRTRQMGTGWFVDLHVLVDGDLTVRHGHDIATQVQECLFEDGPAIADVTVHIEPA